MSEYKRVRVLFPDHLGLARGKYIPAAHANGASRHCISTFGLGYDRSLTAAPGAKILEGLPDCEVRFAKEAIRPSWEEGTGIVVGDLFFQGAPLAMSPRYVLRRAIGAWAELGYRCKVGIELEAYVMERGPGGEWKEWNTPGGYVYGTGAAVDPIGLFDEIMETAERCGLPIESINSEYDIPQFELTLTYGDALETVDHIFLFKLMAREIAAKHGLLLTYLGKPFENRSGSGLHVNLSLLDGDGRNPLADASAADGLSVLAKRAVAGIIAHHAGMAALCAPTVNAYKRLRPAQLAGYWANWGYDHRGVALRIPEERGQGTRLEHRMADGCANPYLATAAMFQAARLGVVNKLTPPDPERQDCLDHQSTDQHVPDDLNQALDALEADAEFVAAIGPEMVAQFAAVKRVEWKKYVSAVTDWELKYYLPFA